MSAQATSWAWGQTPKTPLAKLLLMAMANRADEYGICYRSQKHFAAACCCTVKAVQDNMERLEEAGLIKRRERRRTNGSRTTDLYLLAPRGERGDMLYPEPTNEHWAAVEDMLEAELAQGEDGSPSRDDQGEDGSPRGAKESGGHPDKPLDKPSDQGGEQEELLPDGDDPPWFEGVKATLDRVAAAKDCAKAKRPAILAAAAAFPGADPAKVAEELEYWSVHAGGKRRQIKSLAGTWRTFLRRAASDAPESSVQSTGRNAGKAAKYDSHVRRD